MLAPRAVPALALPARGVGAWVLPLVLTGKNLSSPMCVCVCVYVYMYVYV